MAPGSVGHASTIACNFGSNAPSCATPAQHGSSPELSCTCPLVVVNELLPPMGGPSMSSTFPAVSGTCPGASIDSNPVAPILSC